MPGVTPSLTGHNARQCSGHTHCFVIFSEIRAIVERIIMKLVCKMISTVDYHVFGYEITMYYYAIHWELSFVRYIWFPAEMPIYYLQPIGTILSLIPYYGLISLAPFTTGHWHHLRPCMPVVF